jgi:hypothetical protein
LTLWLVFARLASYCGVRDGWLSTSVSIMKRACPTSELPRCKRAWRYRSGRGRLVTPNNVWAMDLIANAKAAISVAVHFAAIPSSNLSVPAAPQLGDNGAATRQADLPTMGMATQVEGISCLGRMIGDFGRMHGAIRNPSGACDKARNASDV